MVSLEPLLLAQKEAQGTGLLPLRQSQQAKQKILAAISEASIYDVFYVNEFVRRGYGNYRKVLRVLDELCKNGMLVKIRAWPVFYRKVSQ